MTAHLEIIKVTRTAPDVRFDVRVIEGEVFSGTMVLLKDQSRLMGHGRIARIKGGSGAPRRLKAGEVGEVGFKLHAGLDRAAPGNRLDASDGDLQDALKAAIAQEVAATPTDRRILMLPLRVVTTFGAEQIDGISTNVLKVRAYPDTPHIIPGAGAWSESDDAMAAIYQAARAEGPDGEARARADLISVVGLAHATRLMAGDRSERPVVATALPHRLNVSLDVKIGDTTETVLASGRAIPETVPLDMTDDAALSGSREDPLLWLRDYDAAVDLGLAVSVPLPNLGQVRVERVCVAGTPRAQDYGTVLEQKATLESVTFAGAGTPMKGEALPHHSVTPQGHKRAEHYLRAAIPTQTVPDLHPLAALIIWHGAFEPALRRGLSIQAGVARPKAAATLAALHKRFVQELRPEGPCPTLMLDDLPYGLLPVMPEMSDGFSPDPMLFTHLAGRSAEARADLRNKGGWPALIASLGLNDQPHQIFTRALIEGQFEVDLTVKKMQSDPTAARDRVRHVARTWGAADDLLHAHGIAPSQSAPTLATRAVAGREAPRLCGPLLMPDAEADMDRTAPDYLKNVQKHSVADLLEWPYATFPSDHPDSPDAVASLTEVLLVAALRDLLGQTSAYILADGDTKRRLELEALGAVAPPADLPRGWRRLVEAIIGDLEAMKDAPLTDVTAALEREAQDRGLREAQELLADMQKLFDAAQSLGDAPAPRVHRALAGGLDLAATRFDAWNSASATEYLDALPDAPALISAYGLLEDLERRGEGAGERSFNLAPGLDHASTIAVLKAAQDELAHRGLPGISEVDLSPQRVRKALHLAEALQKGIPAEDVLGRRVVAAFRATPGSGRALEALALEFPIDGKSPGRTAEAPDPQLGIDGIALLERFEKAGSIRTLPLRGRQVSVPQNLLGSAIDDLRDHIDALNDLLFAEGVHALCAARPDRAKAAFDALAFGGPTPRRFDVLEGSPDTVELEIAAGILTDAPPPRKGALALAEAFPAAGAVAAFLLGRAMGAVTLTERFAQGVVKQRTVPLSALNLDALAWLNVAPTGADLEGAVRALIAWTAPKVEPLVVDPGRFDPDEIFDPRKPRDFQEIFDGRVIVPGAIGRRLDALLSVPPVVTDVSLNTAAQDWLWLLARAQAAMSHLRGLSPEDLPGSDAAAPEPVKQTDETARTAHHAALRDLADRLVNASGMDGARAALMQAAEAGVLHLMPIWPFDPQTPARADTGAQALGDALHAALRAGQPLVANAPPLPGTIMQKSAAVWLDQDEDLFRWLEDISQVRSALGPLADVTLTAPDPAPWRVLQWYDHAALQDTKAAFIGQQADVTGEADRAEAFAAIDLRQKRDQPDAISGFTIDRWSERAARPERTIGIAVSQDRPTARSGQAILVTAAPKAGLTLEDLLARPGFALDMAKTRMLHYGDWPDADAAVDPLVNGLGQVLPLLWLATGDGDPATCAFTSMDPDLL